MTETTAPEPNDTPAPGTPEYDQMLLARHAAREAENAQAAAEDTPSMPEGGSEKFYDAKTGAYNWEAHVRELEFKLAQREKKQPAAQQDAPKEPESKGPLAIGDAEVQDVVTRAGLSMETLADAIRTDGALPDEAVQALVSQGVPKQLIDEYVELAKFHNERQQMDALAYVGGEEKWSAVSSWAATNLSEADKATYNDMLAGPGWKVAIDALTARMAASGKTAGEPSLRSGMNTMVAPGYASRAELQRDMSDPKYASDPAFRREVAKRVAVSRFEEY